MRGQVVANETNVWHSYLPKGQGTECFSHSETVHERARVCTCPAVPYISDGRINTMLGDFID